MVFWNSPWKPPSSIQPAKGYAATLISSTNRDVAATVAIRAIPFWNKLPAEIVNASSVKSSKTPLDASWQSLFPKVPT